MLKSVKGDFFDSGFLLSAVVTWFLSAVLLLLLSSFVLHKLAVGERSLAYASSVISFLAAAFAGAAAARKRKGGSFYTALISAAVIVTALLTVGFIIEGSRLDPSGVLSVVSFTFAGCVVGAMLFGGRNRVKKKYYPKP